MRFLQVGKTRGSYPAEVRYLLIDEQARDIVRRRSTLAEVAQLIKGLNEPAKDETWFIKNDVPAIVWKTDDTLNDEVIECVRLADAEVHELALLLARR